MPKFSDLAFAAMSAYESVAQAEHVLETARDHAEASADAVTAALRSSPRGKVALVNQGGDVSVYTLFDGSEGYRVETIRGDFDIDIDGPAAPVEPEPEPVFDPALDAFAEFAVS